jgi:hypothetical protein
LNTLEVRKIIAPFWGQTTDKKKRQELIHVGNFIVSSNEKILLKEIFEGPDFKILYKDKIVGLEHSRLYYSGSNKVYRSMVHFFKMIEREIKSINPSLCYTVHLITNRRSFPYKSKEKNLRKAEILEFIINYLEDNSINRSKYIDHIHANPSTEFKIDPSFGSFVPQYISIKDINKKITEKDQLISQYKENAGTQKIWLLIVINELTEDSFQINELNFNGAITNGFDRVYLLDCFFSNVYRIK